MLDSQIERKIEEEEARKDARSTAFLLGASLLSGCLLGYIIWHGAYNTGYLHAQKSFNRAMMNGLANANNWTSITLNDTATDKSLTMYAKASEVNSFGGVDAVMNSFMLPPTTD